MMIKKLLLLLVIPMLLYGDKGDVYLRSGKVYNDVNYAYLVESRQMRVKFNECPERTIIISVDTVLKTENHSYEVRNCASECKQKGKNYHWKGNRCVEEKGKVSEGKTYTNSIGMEFVLVPAGEFTMGCSTGDTECYDDEKPAHTVKISKPFYMGKYEVTLGQWRSVMGTNPSYFKESNCPTEGGCDNHPVEEVSWDDVQKFIRKLNNVPPEGDPPVGRLQAGKYRLPTEAEWEYAARAGTTTKYYWGDESDKADEYAWYSSNSGRTTHPVGQKKPNQFGLYDMSGNVWEWCKDSRYSYSESSQIDPVNRENVYRVVRGGSWLNDTRFIRVSIRRGYSHDLRSSDYGFRLVRTTR